MVAITIKNVNDPENDPVSIKITEILQDEPVNGLGDGDQSPDANGIGTNTALLRAERSGTGDGRVYHVFFEATESHDKDGSAEPRTCTGTVLVSVPHDQEHKVLDSGAKYDSTIQPNTPPSPSIGDGA